MSKAGNKVATLSPGDATEAGMEHAKQQGACCGQWTKRTKYIVVASVAATLAIVIIAAGVAVAVLRGSGAPQLELKEPESQSGTATGAGAPPPQVFVGASALEAMMAEPQSVTLLDARPTNPGAVLVDPAWGKTIPGSVSAKWGEFTAGGGRGDLAPVEQQKAIFEAKGVSSDVPVVIYGGWSSRYAWGEEGRIYWQLDYLGHTNVSILYGGIYGWLDGPDRKGEANPAPGEFRVSVQDEERVESSNILEELNKGVSDGSVVLLDAREAEEYEGDTPYGSTRGGHIPGAVSFSWRNSFDEDGNLRSREDLKANLQQLGVSDDTAVIPYCTGGVRSAFLYAVLRWVGINSVANYDGSWWDWSGNPNLPVAGGSITGGSAIG